MSYKVKKGDTLSSIAKAHNMSLAELLQLNGISKDKANHINVGQELNIGQASPLVKTAEFQIPTATTPLITGTDWQFTPKPKDTDMGIPYAPEYTKADFISDNAKTIQEQLVAAGYNVGNTGVDGKWGGKSQAALDRALAEGYILKGNQLTKPTLKSRKTTSQAANVGIDPKYLKSNALAIQQQLKEFGYDLGTYGKNKDGVDGNWGSQSQTALDQALAEGFTLKNGKLVAPVTKELVHAQFGPFGYGLGLLKYLQNQFQKTNSETESVQEKPSFGTRLNRFINNINSPRMYIADKITQAGANSNDEFIRGVASAGNILLGGFSNALRARINSKINEMYPGWIDEKNKDQIGQGYPVWSIDKEFGLARYYDAEGNLLISSPAGTGLVRGNKSQEGDNKTPEGVYTLSRPELGKNKEGGEKSFGPYFYRTNHKNDNSTSLSGVGLHGTGFPILNGSNVSHGCIRIDNDDIETFYNTSPNKGANTKIIINR